MREIRVNAIQNRLKEVIHYPTSSGSTIDVPQGETVEGSWLIQYDERKHPEMENVASENEVWFVDSPEEFHWGTITFWDPGR